MIDLPKGTYTPVFRACGPPTPNPEAADHAAPSIVVLPFTNLSPEPGDYFSDGLTEEIIHALSSGTGNAGCRPDVFVRSEASECRRARSWQDPECRFRTGRKRAQILRCLASDSAPGQCGRRLSVWSRRYDRQAHDIFAVQDDIAREIVSMLQAGPVASSPVPTVRPSNLDAYAPIFAAAST